MITVFKIISGYIMYNMFLKLYRHQILSRLTDIVVMLNYYLLIRLSILKQRIEKVHMDVV